METTAAPDPEVRLLSIAADLLPEEIVAARRVRRRRFVSISTLVVVVVGLGAWYGVARYQTARAERALEQAQSQVHRLQRQQGAFAEVISAQNQSQAIRGQLATLLAEDLPWSPVLAELRDAAPKGVQVVAVSGVLTAASADGGIRAAGGGTGASSQGSDGRGEKPVGTLTVSGAAESRTGVAAYVDAVAGLPGLGNPLLGDMITQDGELHFTVRVEITRAALGGRYTAKTDAKTDAKRGAGAGS